MENDTGDLPVVEGTDNIEENESNTTDTPIYDAITNGDLPDEINWSSTVRKAFVGSAVGAATAVTTTLPATLSDGVFTLNELALVVTAVIGAAVVGFAAVWRVPNKG